MATIDLGKITASVTVGNTATGEPGSNASVTNSGTTQDAVLNFTVPRGPKGDTVILGNEEEYTLYNVQGNSTIGAMTQDATTKSISAQTGYYVCETAEGTAAKVVSGDNLALYTLTSGGHFKIKMTYKNSAANATLKLGNATAKPLYYNGERASASNSWEEGEVISVYYDGTNYQASNAMGGGSAVGKKKLTPIPGYIDNHGETLGSINNTGSNATNYRYQKYPASEGDVIMISGTGISAGLLWGVVGDNDVMIDKSAPNITVKDFIKVMPEGTRFITLNSKTESNPEWYYAKKGSVGAHEMLTENYLYKSIKELAVGQLYEASEEVKSPYMELLRITKEVKFMFLTAEVAVGDWKAYNGATYQAQKAVGIYQEETTYNEGDYAIVDGSLKKYDGENWNTVTLADYAADAVAVGETDDSKMWKTLGYEDLLAYTEQNFAPKLYNSTGGNTDGAITQEAATKAAIGKVEVINLMSSSTSLNWWFTGDCIWNVTSGSYPYYSRIPKVDTGSTYRLTASDTTPALYFLTKSNVPASGVKATDWNGGNAKRIPAGESVIVNTEDYTYLALRYGSNGSTAFQYPKIEKCISTEESFKEANEKLDKLAEHEVYEVKDMFDPQVQTIIDDCGTNAEQRIGDTPRGTYDIAIYTPNAPGVTFQLRFLEGSTWKANINNIPLDGNVHIYRNYNFNFITSRLYEVYSTQGNYGKLSIYMGKPWGTVSTAIRHIPESERKVGLIVKFPNPNGEFSMYKHIGNDLTDFETITQWHRLDSNDDTSFAVNASLNLQKLGLGVIADPSDEDFGKIVSTGTSMGLLLHIPCEGYNYLDTRLWPTNGDGYKYGLVFYDEDYEPIEGYGSMSIVAASGNTSNPYWNPVHLEIPSNAVFFSMSYKGSLYPPVTLIRGNNSVYSAWDKFTYTGERIVLSETHNVYVSRCMRFDDGLEGSHQGGCVWGDYLFVFNTDGQFSVLDMTKCNGGGNIVDPIQSAISTPGVSGSHNDSPCFTNRYYDSNDEFPLLLCGGGNTTGSGDTYFYVLRIVKNTDGDDITFTSTLVQTITVKGDGWRTPYYDKGRGVIVTCHGTKTVVTNKTVSATAGDYTIDLNDSSNIIQEFPYDIHSGSVYNNGKLFGVQAHDTYASVHILDVYDGKYTTFNVGRWSEAEGIVMYNNDLYIYYLGWIGKVHFE